VTDLTPIAPAEPLGSYLGGKRLLAKRIVAKIDTVPHRCYTEPFVGMGGVFLRRDHRPKSEILNAINDEIVNLFRVLREHPEALEAQFDLCLASRAEFIRLIQTRPETLTDIRRVARWTYIQLLTFGGKPTHLATPGQFAPSETEPAPLRADRMARLIRAAHSRLKGVHIEQMDWAAFVRATTDRRRSSTSIRRIRDTRPITVAASLPATTSRGWRTCCGG